jgi:cell surface protein SprA
LKRRAINILRIIPALLLVLVVIASDARIGGLDSYRPQEVAPPDTGKPDSLRYHFDDDDGNPYTPSHNNKLYMGNPPNVSYDYEYDPNTGQYVLKSKVGELNYRLPFYMSQEDFLEYDMSRSIRNYWRQRSMAGGTENRGKLIPPIPLGNLAETVLGGSTVDIRPQGSAELIFGLKASNVENPALDVRQQKTANFDFREKIQLNVRAKIGDKIEFGTNYNTESSFEFENKMNLAYQGKEDEILQLIEAGDVTLPLNGTLITGSQALFGIKTKLQFGRTTFTTVLSQQKSETSSISVAGGAQTSEFYFKADEYEESKHYFISQYFRNNYDNALSRLPIINSPINITKIEVWVTSLGPATQENRNIVAFQDLGEFRPFRQNEILPTSNDSFPSNSTNDLFVNAVNINTIRDLNQVTSYLSSQAGFPMVAGLDYEKVENARRLNPNEYFFNSKLGFISLNSRLNPDQVLAVSFQYTVIGDTTVYQVGEFSNGGIVAPNCLMVKLLKSTTINTSTATWDLMMKNVYSINAFQVNAEDFRLNILYAGEENGIPMAFLTEGAIKGLPLIQVMNLDNINTMRDPSPDGVFDFVDGAHISGGTINAANGRIYFPVTEPFGSHLRKKIGDNLIADKYVFDELYRKTKYEARQFPAKNKFYLEGTYKSASGSEISLNAMNVPQGSVKVTAGGVVLTENVDYTVDYTLGRVRIINEGYLNSGTPINISLESNSLFNVQQKRLFGTHVDYRVNRDINLGATVLNLTEKPLTEKVNFGDEPISNTIWGLDATYAAESQLITKLIDKLPLIETKTPSRVLFSGEFAHLIPGHSRAINVAGEKNGLSYIDDFESSSSGVDLKNIGAWSIASVPQGQNSTFMFPESKYDSITTGFNRAKLAWYVIDPLFVRNNNITPQHIKNDPNQQSDHRVREVLESEVFPNRDPQNGQPLNIAMLNLAYYPEERGPYNFDVEGMPGVSAGLNADGTLKSPSTRWAGIMREFQSTDFEANNYEYIEFWMMDPFINSPNHSGGDLYFNLGDISEDVLKDSRKSFENGLPTSTNVTNVDTTIWGRVPTLQALVNAFDNDPAAREFQDVGLDGLGDPDESLFFEERYAYLTRIANLYGTGSAAYIAATQDPSADNFHYFRGTDFDNNQVSILDRYKQYNGPDGNSPTPDQSSENYPTQATTIPDVEDINKDNTLGEDERYFQYKISLKPGQMNIGKNYISDVYVANNVPLKNGTTANVTWYQFRIPIQSPERAVGQIQDFKSIRFMRMFFKNWNEEVVLRMATMELVRGEWRKYTYDLLSPGEYIPNDEHGNTTFEISTVNIEENGKRQPIPYVLPPGITREININSTSLAELNEQSLVLKVCNLMDGDARAGYKTTDFDLRRYQRLKMFVHAEESDPAQPLQNGDMTVFIRLGSDFTENYYEYEIPLSFTPWYTSALDDDAIWPAENAFDVEIQKLVDAKQERNVKMRQPASTILLSDPYVIFDGKNKITVVGTPNLADVKTIMIGVRNPKKDNINDPDDGREKCAEIWVNELRLTDFDEHGGWAANGRLSADLADLGNVVLAGAISTPGFGSIEKKITERQLERIMQYDVATNLELGKLFPSNYGLRIPMHFDFSETMRDPEYNPLNPDVNFKEDLETYTDPVERDSIRNLSRDYTRRTNLNFMNVKKTSTGAGAAKPKIYSLDNFDLTYSYSELYMRNVDIEYHLKKKYLGAVGYNFSTNPKNIRPFGKSAFLGKHKSLALIRDINFYYMPKMLSFRTDMNREYDEKLLRNKSRGIVPRTPYYVKRFDWNRMYDLRYNVTQGLQIDYKAVANARIKEPDGRIDRDDDDYIIKRDSILDEIKSFGRMQTYNQQITANYNVPINKLPLLSFVTANVRYTGNYRWYAAPLALEEVGNTIENSNDIQFNGTANFTNLYNKVPYLKTLNTPVRKPGPQPRSQVVNPLFANDPDSVTKEKVNYGKIALNTTLRLLTSVKMLNLTYSESNGTVLPGFNPVPDILGNDMGLMAPGLDFVFGWQSDDLIERAFRNNWITSSDSLVTAAYQRKFNSNLNFRGTVEPFPTVKIEITANRTMTQLDQSYLRYDPDADKGYFEFSPTSTGSFSMSFYSWKSAFESIRDTISPVFEQFKLDRQAIAQRLAESNPNWNGTYRTDSVSGVLYPDGYGATSQDVLIPAFIAAYAGIPASEVGLTPFPSIPKPNWRLTFNAPTQAPWIKKYIRTLTITHAYRSNYSVGSFGTNARYKSDDDGFQYVRDELGLNYVAKYEINTISIMEQFAPLIRFDMTMQNSFMANIEIKKSRNLSLSFSNNQLTEVISNELIIGTGYSIKDVEFTAIMGGTRTRLKSDLNIKADVSIRSNRTVLRKIVEDVNQTSQGQQVVTINLSADYMVSQRFNVRLFFDRVVTDPFISGLQFPNSNTNAGLSLRFTLAP